MFLARMSQPVKGVFLSLVGEAKDLLLDMCKKHWNRSFVQEETGTLENSLPNLAAQ